MYIPLGQQNLSRFSSLTTASKMIIPQSHDSTFSPKPFFLIFKELVDWVTMLSRVFLGRNGRVQSTLNIRLNADWLKIKTLYKSRLFPEADSHLTFLFLFLVSQRQY